MKSAYLDRQVTRCNRNLLLTNILLLVAVIGVVLMFRWAYQDTPVKRDPGFDVLDAHFVAFLLIPLMAARNIIIAVVRFAVSDRHPILKKLEAYGEGSRNVIQSINTEATRPVAHCKLKTFTGFPASVLVTHNWIIVQHFFTLRFIPVYDIIWIYKSHTIMRTIGTEHQYSVNVHLRNRRLITILEAVEQDVNQLLQHIHQVAPWIPCGYSDELHGIAMKQKDTLIAHVDQERSKMGGSNKPSAPYQ